MECSDKCPIYEKQGYWQICPFLIGEGNKFPGKCLYPEVHKFQMERMGETWDVFWDKQSCDKEDEG